MSRKQDFWRRCLKCEGLFHCERSRGVCPAGGSHDPFHLARYTLDLDNIVPPNQPAWKSCAQCGGLFSLSHVAGGVTDFGLCPAGGMHDPRSSGDYAPFDAAIAIATPGVLGHFGWLRCNACEGLFFGGGNTTAVNFGAR